MFGKIYETTWWGNPTINAWGNIYYDLAQTEPLLTINFESISCIDSATPSIIE